MQIKDIEKLADLAKIELTNKEKEDLVKDLDSVLDYVKQIESVDLPAQAGVQDVEPPARNAFSIADAGGEYLNKNVWREDLPRDGRGEKTDSVFSRDLIINQFPDAKDGFVKVKKIL
ncbi:MAG: Asp-tRNA(Asn)/Glu-tRNA(Gln) amidotransferase subunit GatC [Patescibacteria group bacterium]